MVPATAMIRFIKPLFRFARPVRPTIRRVPPFPLRSPSLAQRRKPVTLAPTHVIRLDQISKQHGKQILFLEASMGVFKGEKVGLVGPNGAGKSTIFRMIVKEEEPDGGNVAIDRGITIGYFSQDVGEMKGRSVVAETMAGAGEVSEAAEALHSLEHAMADPARADEIEELVEKFGHAQARFDELGGYALEARAREILAGLGFHDDTSNTSKARGPSMGADVSTLSGGWKMRVALARILLMLRPDALLLDEPTNHLDLESILWLEGFLRQFEGALIMTSHDRELLNRLVTKIVEIDGGELTTYSGNYEFYEAQRALANLAPGGAVRAAAGHAGQRRGLHRALQGAGLARGAGPVAREEARQDRAGGTAQAGRRA